MIGSLSIKGYRCFREFTAEGFARVNLLVGKNNAGKTALLEALHFQASGGDVSVFNRAAFRRGETVVPEDWETDPSQPQTSVLADISHLFHGHQLDISSSIEFEADGLRTLVLSVAPEQVVNNDGYPGPGTDTIELPARLTVSRGPDSSEQDSRVFTLSAEGGLFLRVPRRTLYAMQMATKASRHPVGLATQFISTETIQTRELATLWDNILLQGGKPDVIAALGIIEPSLVNIEFLTGELVDRNGGNSGGVLVEFGDPIVRVPLGSLGEGMRRLLVLAIALSNSKGGALFIDEIDTGLHYSVLGRMWKLVAEAAAKFDIQVFATTHSADCVRGLEMFGRVTPEARNDIAILKLVQGHDRAVSLTGEEAVDALELGIEVR